jgi:hypothetical protein
MRICDLNSGLGRIANAMATLKQRWRETKEQWHDENARKFEDENLRPIPEKLQGIIAAVQRLGEVLDLADRDLSDQPES